MRSVKIVDEEIFEQVRPAIRLGETVTDGDYLKSMKGRQLCTSMFSVYIDLLEPP